MTDAELVSELMTCAKAHSATRVLTYVFGVTAISFGYRSVANSSRLAVVAVIAAAIACSFWLFHRVASSRLHKANDRLMNRLSRIRDA